MKKIDPNVKIVAIPNEMMGRKYKYKVLIDNKLYIMKFNGINYEIFAELIAERIGKQLGIEMAHYDICEYKGHTGLITPVFLDTQNGELIMSVKALLETGQDICFENNIKFDLKENTIENIIRAVSLYDKRVDLTSVMKELTKRWLFYGLIMESDKNNTNISFIKDQNSNLKLSPDYDNSTMARMNEDINTFIDNLKHGADIYSLIDKIKTALKIDISPNDEFLVNYKLFLDDYAGYYKDVIESFENISIDDAIAEVEQDNEIEVPWEIKYWLNKTITARKNDMLSLLHQKLDKDNNNQKKH